MIIDFQNIQNFRSIKDVYDIELPTKNNYPLRFQYRVTVDLPVSR